MADRAIAGAAGVAIVRKKVQRPIRRAIARGHPWIFRDALTIADAPGTVAHIQDTEGHLATCFVDPTSPIAARVLSCDEIVPDETWAFGRGRHAMRWRGLHPGLRRSNAMRLVHGESDFCPGLVIDAYDETAVVVFDGVAAHAFWQPRLRAVFAGLGEGGRAVQRVVQRAVRDSTIDAHDSGVGSVAISEGATRFSVDVARGQKTGFFLDQRDNRFLVGELAAGRSVLNVFCYTGGFSLHAAAGGAARVTSVDLAAPATHALAQNIELSQQAASRHEVVTGDAFAFLEAARDAGRVWDLVITDPPSFAKSQKARPAALAAYLRLARLALSVTSPQGLYACASCSSHVTQWDLRAVLAEAEPNLRLTHVNGAAPDHPTLPGFPESHYLKFLLAARA